MLRAGPRKPLMWRRKSAVTDIRELGRRGWRLPGALTRGRVSELYRRRENLSFSLPSRRSRGRLFLGGLIILGAIVPTTAKIVHARVDLPGEPFQAKVDLDSKLV